MQRMCRRTFAAVAGLLAVAGIASAQNPPPGYYQPLPVPAAAAANPVTPASGSVFAKGSGGCASCGTPAAAPAPAGRFAQYGPVDRNGCGSLRSDLGFMFGSCKSFFDPCGPQPCDGRNRRNCGVHPFAAPYGTGYNGCQYDSYLNH